MSSESDENEADYIEPEEPETLAKCLFCNQGGSVADLQSMNGGEWANDEWMVPYDVEDGLLQFDFDSFVGLCDGDFTPIANVQAEPTEEVMQLRAALDEMRTRLERYMQDDAPSGRSVVSGGRGDDAYYKESYAHYGIHAEMIKDEVRTKSYHDAILSNASLFNGKRVLDVGCGTGILAMFSAKAGAAHVTGVEFSDIAFDAMEIVSDNKLDHVIDIKHCRLEDLEVTVPYDIVISEWMGYFLTYECMLSSVLHARDHFLKPDGVVLPDKFRLFICGMSHPRIHNEEVDCWHDVYGFSMASLAKAALSEAVVRNVDPYQIGTDAACVKEYDLNNRAEDENAIEFDRQFTLTAKAAGQFYGWVGYFTTKFDDGCGVAISFSTGPEAPPTHWKQTLFLLPKPFSVTAGQKLEMSLKVRKHPECTRWLLVSFLHDGSTFEYHIR